MRKHLKYSAAITLSLVLLSNPFLALALGEQKALSRPIATASSDYSSGSRKASKILKLPVSSSARTGKQATSPEGQTITLLHDGRQLLTGGQGADEPQSTAAIKDPHTNEVTLLPYGLQHSRAWHTATTLPDGTVLILGGIGADGQVVESAELFTPETQAFESLDASKPQSAFRNPKSAIALTPRAYHTATLVTEGVVLIVGGMSKDGKFQKKAQLFDPQSRTARTLKAAPRTPRYGHMATLLADGNVLIQGGADTNGKAIDSGEIYDPTNQRFTRSDTDIDQQSKIRSPQLEASLPKDRETSVPVDSRIALRFSKPLRVETLNAETVTLTNAFGNVEAKIVPAEGGMLAFITPKSHLLPGTFYVLSLSLVSDSENLVLADTTISFTTAVHFPTNFRPIDNEEWIPNENNLRGDWRSGRADSPWRSLPPLLAVPGVTALAGQALTLNGQPLDNVTLKIEDKTAQTDSTGRFLLAEVPAGHHELLIDGRSASRAGKTYGMFEAAVNVEGGKTNVLSYTIWMPKIDIAHAVTIPSPTTREAVITTPRIPGLEVHIPPQTVIRDHDGNVVTEVSITPIPLDRTPFPLPQGVDVPIYFTVQPGGAYVHTYNSEGPKGARLIYPNYKHRPASTRFDFWHYDPEQRGWYIYGQGTVADDARQVVPDPNVSIYEFTGAMVAPPALAPQDGPVDCSNDGDPVNLGTGLFVLSKTDLILPDVLPIVLTRTYRQRDTLSRAFGIGASHSFDLFLVGTTFPYTYVDLVMPNGGRIHYDRISPGTSYADAVYENTSSPTSFYKTRIAWNGNGYDLALKDGTVLTFREGFEATRPGQAGLLKIKDRYGNATIISRDSSGNVTQIVSPNARWIQFTNDASNRITQAKDNIGRTVNYTYDGSGRLWKVTDPGSGVTEYTYDGSNRMTSIKNPPGIIYVTNEYDTNGRVSRQTHIDGGVYQFGYTLDGNGKISQTDVTDPRGNLRRVTFNSSGYTLSDTQGCCAGLAHTFELQAGTNLILSVTDPLGRRTSDIYDSSGNVTSITLLAGTPEAVTTNLTHEPAFNHVASVTDPLGHTTSFGYDSKGSLTSLTDALNHQTTFAFNQAGQLVSATDPLSNLWQAGYDSGDFTTETNPLGQSTVAFTDGAGRVISLTDPLGQTTRYEVDALDRPTIITDPLLGVTSYSYDANSNLLSITDARNNVTSTQSHCS